VIGHRGKRAATGRPLDGAGAGLREHRDGGVVWITTPAWEGTGRALGFPDPAVVARFLTAEPGDAEGARGRAATRIATIAGSERRLHVRRVLHGGWLAPLWRGRIAGLARVRRELALTLALHDAGAPVPAPAFVLAQRVGWSWRAVFCTVHVEGAIDGIHVLREGGSLAAAARAAGTAVRDLHDRGARHADLHVGNLLVRSDADGGCSAWVIDMDRARLDAPVGDRRRSRELRRLLRSLRKRAVDTAQIDVWMAAFRTGYGPRNEHADHASD